LSPLQDSNAGYILNCIQIGSVNLKPTYRARTQIPVGKYLVIGALGVCRERSRPRWLKRLHDLCAAVSRLQLASICALSCCVRGSAISAAVPPSAVKLFIVPAVGSPLGSHRPQAFRENDVAVIASSKRLS
jgi:hypothetical protein